MFVSVFYFYDTSAILYCCESIIRDSAGGTELVKCHLKMCGQVEIHVVLRDVDIEW